MQATIYTHWLGIKNRLNSKRAAVACLFVAVAGKCLIAFVYASLKADKALYLLFAQSLVETGRLAEPVYAFETGTRHYLYDPAVNSPLYSCLCAPFFWLTNSFFTTQLIVAFLGWGLFLTALFTLAKLLFSLWWRVSFFLLFASFFLYPHELGSGPKDTLAAGFSLWAVVVAHRFLTQKANAKATAVLAVLIACVALTKLLYVPLAFLFFAALLVLALCKKSKRHAGQAGLLAGFLLLIGCLVHFFLLLPSYRLAASQIRLPSGVPPPAHGFYPRNLLVSFPFISSSFVNTTLVGVQVERHTPASFADVLNFFRLLDVLLFPVLVWVCVRPYRSIARQPAELLLLAVSMTMTGVLVFLSAAEEPTRYRHIANTFTFIADGRSFLLPMLSLQLFAFRWLFSAQRRRFLRYALALLLFFEASHGLYFVVKEAVTASATPEAKVNNDALQKINAWISEENAKGNRLRLVSSDNAVRRYVQVHNLPAFAFTRLRANPSWMKKGDRFLVVTFPQDSLLLKCIPSTQLIRLRMVEPFVLHTYEVP